VPTAADSTLLKDTGDSELFLAGMRRVPAADTKMRAMTGHGRMEFEMLWGLCGQV